MLKLTDENSCSDDKFAIFESDGSTSELDLTFSINIHARTLHALVFHTNNNIELKSFTDVAIDERVESEIAKNKFEPEIEENSPPTLSQVFILIFWLR